VSISLIVGLGNPEARYVATRHNAGFWAVDDIAQKQHTQFRLEAKFQGEVCRVEQADLKYWLLKPTTFMNRSGQAVVALANYYKIPPQQILIIHDDLDFPPGIARLKKGGSDCRHNGLKSIIAHLGSNQFLRLRLGIGHPGHRDEVTNYVLNAPTRDEQTAIDTAIKASLDVIPLILTGEVNKAMQQLHTSLANSE
jgi:peptidyl-tRNA hydrolase, PTH1 family